MTNSEKLAIVQELRQLQTAPRSTELTDRVWAGISSNHPAIVNGCFAVGWKLSPPYENWNYWHCLTNEGGVVLFSLDELISRLELLEEYAS